MVKQTGNKPRVGDGTPGPGRPKGSKNKSTVAAKEAIQMAFEGIGGAPRLTAWVQSDPDNEKAFWTSIYPRLLPLQVNGDVGLTIVLPNGSKGA